MVVCFVEDHRRIPMWTLVRPLAREFKDESSYTDGIRVPGGLLIALGLQIIWLRPVR
jgi:hypothetical protein